MDYQAVINGLIIGFSIAAPVGPIGVLCIRRTLTQGRWSGLVSGLGAATADALYGCLAAFGITFISNLLVQQQLWLRLFGGLFLCFLGVRTITSKPSEKDCPNKSKGLVRDFGSTFLLTLTNPLTILSFAGIFAGLGLANASGDYAYAAFLVLSVFGGSALWWLILSSSVSLANRKVTSGSLRWINIVSGIVILGFGVFVLGSTML